MCLRVTLAMPFPPWASSLCEVVGGWASRGLPASPRECHLFLVLNSEGRGRGCLLQFWDTESWCLLAGLSAVASFLASRKLSFGTELNLYWESLTCQMATTQAVGLEVQGGLGRQSCALNLRVGSADGRESEVFGEWHIFWAGLKVALGKRP